MGVSLSIEAGSVPERRGKFTLPGGKPAFAPGWDEQPVIEDDEAELRAEIRMINRPAALPGRSCFSARAEKPAQEFTAKS